MPAPSPSLLGLPYLSIPLFSAVAGAALVLFFFSKYFRLRKAEVASIAVPPEPKPTNQKSSKHAVNWHGHKKSHARSHLHVSDKVRGMASFDFRLFSRFFVQEESWNAFFESDFIETRECTGPE